MARSVSFKPISITLLVCTGLVISIKASGQKIEVEERIREPEFPQPALQYVDSNFQDIRRLRFYREQSRDSVTYEAKFKVGSERYSVEFYPDGSLMDVEKTIDYRSIDQGVRDSIEVIWNRDFRRWKVLKCQEQKSYLGKRYEIEMKGRSDKGVKLWQYTFDAVGSQVDRERILPRSNDMNLY